MINTPNTMNTTSGTFLSIWNNLSLRTKLVSILIMVALIPLVIVGLISNGNSRQSLINDANEKLLGSAASVAAQLDNLMQAGLDTVRYQAHLPVVTNYMTLPQDQRMGSAEEGQLLEFLLAAANENPVYITSIAVLDAGGTTLIDTSAAEVGVSSAYRMYFHKVLETSLPYASTVEYDDVTGKPSLYFAAPIQNANDELIGVLRVRYDALILQDIIAQNTGRAGASSFAMLLDENHVRLAHGTARESIQKSVVPLNANLAAQLQSQYLFPAGNPQDLATNLKEFEAGLKNIDNQPTFTAALEDENAGPEQVAIIRMKAQNWLVAFAQPEAVFLAPLQTQARTYGLTALLIALGVVIFGAGAAQVLSMTAVQTEASVWKKIAAHEETDAEIGLSTHTFSTMTASQSQAVENTTAAPALPTPALLLANLHSKSVVNESENGQFKSQPDEMDYFAGANTDVEVTVTAQVSTTVQKTSAPEQNQPQVDHTSPAKATARRAQRAEVSPSKLSKAIRRLGKVLEEVRVSADVSNHTNDKFNQGQKH
jgi:hypothetical protein